MNSRIRSLILAVLLAMAPIAASEDFPTTPTLAGICLSDGTCSLIEVSVQPKPKPVVELARFFAQFDWRSDGSGDTIRRVRPLIFIGHGTCRGKGLRQLSCRSE